MLRGETCGLGRGVSVIRYEPDTRLAVGDGFALYDGALIRLEGRGAQVEIGDHSNMAQRSEINAHARVTVGVGCAIPWDIYIVDSDYHRSNLSESPTAPITIGDGAIVAAGAVVTADVPPRTLVGGTPARVMRTDVEWENLGSAASVGQDRAQTLSDAAEDPRTPGRAMSKERLEQHEDRAGDRVAAPVGGSQLLDH